MADHSYPKDSPLIAYNVENLSQSSHTSLYIPHTGKPPKVVLSSSDMSHENDAIGAKVSAGAMFDIRRSIEYVNETVKLTTSAVRDIRKYVERAIYDTQRCLDKLVYENYC